MGDINEVLYAVNRDDANFVEKWLQGKDEFVDYSTPPGVGELLLHRAVWLNSHKIVKVLLRQSNIDVNQKAGNNSTAFMAACGYNNTVAARLLLNDPRVDVTLTDGRFAEDNNAITALCKAVLHGATEVIKYWIATTAVSGVTGRVRYQDMDFNFGCYAIPGSDPLDIAPLNRHPETVALLKAFQLQPVQVRSRLQWQLGGYEDVLAVDLFAVVIFFCDGLLSLPLSLSQSQHVDSSKTARFFTIVSKLPMELQMCLCYRVFDSATTRSKSNITSQEAESAFHRLTTMLLSDSVVSEQ